MMYRFRKAMQNEAEGWVNPTPNEPLLPSTCESLPAALHARKELMKDISRKISKIHDKDLDDSAIRSLNDDINRQIRKKLAWDTRIVELGHVERDKTVRWGDEMLPEPGNVHGYYYFGRAKELPGVQDLLNPRREAATKLPARVIQMEKTADGEYFGMDTPEVEDVRREMESEVEIKLCTTKASLADWTTGLPLLLPIIPELPPANQVNVPSQQQVEEYLIERRRAELLSRYIQKT